MLSVHTSPLDADLVTGCAAVYAAAFAEPPYGETTDQAVALAERLDRYAQRDGFCVPIVQDDAGEVIGFALAVTGRPGDWWREQVAAALGPAGERRWLGPGFTEIVHLAVHPGHRRRGLARDLLCALVATSTDPTAVLSCHPDAPAALRLYLSEGFAQIHEDFRTHPEQLGFRLLAKELAGRPPTGK